MITINIVFVLMLIQLSRAGLVLILHSVYEPAVLFANFTLVLIGIVLCLIFKPDKNKMGLNFSHNKKLYIISTLIIVLLIIFSPVFYVNTNFEDIIFMLESVLLFPIFEELLFRGYIWSEYVKCGIKEWKIYLITTVLFGLWHLGYWDAIYYRASQNFEEVNMPEVMFFKVLIGMAFGTITGFVRLKTKNVYSSILVHSFLNIFGR